VFKQQFRVELIDKSGTRKHNLTLTIANTARTYFTNLLSELYFRAYQRLERGKYKCTYNAFRHEWTILQYYKV